MSYIQQKIGTKDVSIEYRLVVVIAGSNAPTPVTGYSMSAKMYTDGILDFYLEYREFEGALIPI